MTPEPISSSPPHTPTKKRPSTLWWIALGLLVVLAAVVSWMAISGRLPLGAPALNGTVIQSPDQVADFTLDGSNGKRVSLSDLRGKVVLVYFGYTFCPDVCPTTLNELKKVLPPLGDRADDVQVVMVTVDPQRDTPEILREYLAHFHPSFLGLTGTDDEIMAAATPLGIYYNAHEGSPASGYLVDHTSSVLAIDRNGYLRLIYGFETTGEAIAEDMPWLLRQ